MAEGWLRHLGGDRFEAFSAGTQPVGLSTRAVEVMREVGVDIRQHRSKHVEEFQGQAFDYVITVCDRARESCPVWPGAERLLHWSFDDPAAVIGDDEVRRAVFRCVRNEIGVEIRRLLESAHR